MLEWNTGRRQFTSQEQTCALTDNAVLVLVPTICLLDPWAMCSPEQDEGVRALLLVRALWFLRSPQSFCWGIVSMPFTTAVALHIAKEVGGVLLRPGLTL